MSVGLDGNPGRRARRVAIGGLGAGVVCLLAGTGVYLGAELDMLPATWTAADRPTAARNLALAAVAVLGTILASVGTVFALIERTGVLRDAQAPEPRRPHAAPSCSSPARVPAPASVPPAGPAGEGDTEPDAARLRGAASDDRPDGRISAAPNPGGGDPTPAHSTAPASEDAPEPEPEAPPEPRAAVTAATAPARPVEEPPPPETPQPGDLIAAWDSYRRDGDGHFNPHGLQTVLDQRRLAANVSDGDRVGAGSNMLLVEARSRHPQFYVLPSFAKSPRAVADWFDDSSGGALTGRTQRVIRVGEGRWTEGGFEVVGKGVVA